MESNTDRLCVFDACLGIKRCLLLSGIGKKKKKNWYQGNVSSAEAQKLFATCFKATFLISNQLRIAFKVDRRRETLKRLNVTQIQI